MMAIKNIFGIKAVLLVAAAGSVCWVPIEGEAATKIEAGSAPATTRLALPPQSEQLPEQLPQHLAQTTQWPQAKASSARAKSASPGSANTDGLVLDGTQPIQQLSPRQLAATSWEGASFPVENFQTYTSAFGYRESPTGGYSQEFHYGLDMAAPEESYVRNWWTGIVKEVSDDTACGTSVVVQSGDWTATYCHMQGYVETSEQGRHLLDQAGGLKIQQGQRVAAGDRIGRVGMTGRTTGPHLHWTLKYQGSYVDPGFVLRAMYQAQPSARQEE